MQYLSQGCHHGAICTLLNSGVKAMKFIPTLTIAIASAFLATAAIGSASAAQWGKTKNNILPVQPKSLRTNPNGAIGPMYRGKLKNPSNNGANKWTFAPNANVGIVDPHPTAYGTFKAKHR